MGATAEFHPCSRFCHRDSTSEATRAAATLALAEVLQVGLPRRHTAGVLLTVDRAKTLDNDGVPVTLAGAFILMFDDSGLCRSLREYWQFTEGTREPKPGWGT